jgi:mono/diheme cytochrome c family protein
VGVGSDDRMIKLVLNGLYGPIEVAGQKYSGQVPMTPFGAMLNDEEIAAVITYVRIHLAIMLQLFCRRK